MVLDTHMWVWFNNGNRRLPAEISERIEFLGSEGVLSVASVWEVMLLLKKGKLNSRFQPQETIERWLVGNPLRVVPIDLEVSFLCRTLPFVHEDPADRFIAATAHSLGYPLATIDEKLTSLPWLRTIPTPI